MAENMLLVINTPDEEITGRIIKSNIKELLPAVIEACGTYRATQYTLDQERICREHRATVNKFLTAVNAEIKRIGELNNAPFARFRDEMQPVLDEVTGTIKFLDNQLLEMEENWRGRNLKNAEILYHDVIGGLDLEEWLPWEKILLTKKTARVTYEANFGNKGAWSYEEGKAESEAIEDIRKAGSKIIADLQAFADMVIKKQDSLYNMDFPEEITAKGIEYMKGSYDPVKKGLDFDGAVSLMTDLKRREEEKAAAVEAAKREAEEAARKAVEEAEKKAREVHAAKEKELQEQRERLQAQLEEMQRKADEAEKRAREEADTRADIQKAIDEFPMNAPEEEREWVAFNAYLTPTQAYDLADWLNARHIEFKPV